MSEEASDPGIEKAQRGKRSPRPPPQYLPPMDSLKDLSRRGSRLTACDSLSLCKPPAPQTPNQSDSSREHAWRSHSHTFLALPGNKDCLGTEQRIKAPQASVKVGVALSTSQAAPSATPDGLWALAQS